MTVPAVEALLYAFGSRIRLAIREVEQVEDRVSADLCTEVARGIDKWLWFVEAHVHTR